MTRLKGLSLLRAILCIGVFTLHCISWNSSAIYEGITEWFDYLGPIAMLIDGTMCVCGFFVLSGFGMAYHFKGNNEIKTIIRKVVYIFGSAMLVYVFTVMSHFLLSVIGNVDFEVRRIGQDLAYLIFGIGEKNHYAGPLWYIHDQCLGYIVGYAILSLAKELQGNMRKVIYILSILYFMHINQNIACVLLGVLVGEICLALRKIEVKWNKLFLLMVMLIVGYLLPQADKFGVAYVGMVYAAIIGLAWIYEVKCEGSIPYSKVISFIDTYSFEIYLIHGWVLNIITAGMFNYVFHWEIGVREIVIGWIFTACITVILSIPLKFFLKCYEEIIKRSLRNIFDTYKEKNSI